MLLQQKCLGVLPFLSLGFLKSATEVLQVHAAAGGLLDFLLPTQDSTTLRIPDLHTPGTQEQAYCSRAQVQLHTTSEAITAAWKVLRPGVSEDLLGSTVAG